MSTPALVEWSLPRCAAQIEDMRRRLRAARFPESVFDGWTGGVDVAFLRRFTAFLADEYAWEADLERFSGRHIMVRHDETGSETPAVHVWLPLTDRTAGTPLVMLHGWPSCGFEFVHVARRLAGEHIYPVVVDLPGFGFSGATGKPIGPRAMAGYLKRVLVDGLGLDRMVIHGNDWGSVVASWLAIDYPQVLRGMLLSMMALKPNFSAGLPRPDEHELAWIKAVQRRLAADAGYREIQATKPNTAAVGLSDSPTALAAWVIEKFHGWTGGDLRADPPVAREDLAAVVTAYWLSGNIASANWIYAAILSQDDTIAPSGGTGDVPVAFSLFGNGFFPAPPESWARRLHRVVDYSLHPDGGHFPALTRPDALSQDLLRFCRTLQ